jgi:glycosyltransferase involved in cell wall biosynthesis
MPWRAHVKPADIGRLHVAMVGTRGIPARYGGFETAVEEIGTRLVARGHQVTVFCRQAAGSDRGSPPSEYRGVDLVHLPAARRKTVETLSHTALSAFWLLKADASVDVILLFNAANSLLIPALRRRGVPVATHVDGLEWKRAKWSGVGRRYYRLAEGFAVRWSDALIADAQGIADYYSAEFAAPTDVIKYGAPILSGVGHERLAELGLEPDKYHLVVARFEPENHVAEAVTAYRNSAAELPLVVVGSAPYSDAYTARVQRLAAGDARINLVGGVWDQGQLDQLYAHALTYVHGHSVGGTNPSLLRAMGAATAVLAYDVIFNRETLGVSDGYWEDSDALTPLFEKAEGDPAACVTQGRQLQERAASHYEWDAVTDGYEALCRRLATSGQVRRSMRAAPSLIEVIRR